MIIDVSKQPERVMFTTNSGSGEIISVVELIILPDIFGQKPAGYIHKVYTEPTHQNEGLASKLLCMALAYARDQDCHKVFLFTPLGNVKFYEDLGFEADQCGLVKRFE